MLLIIRIMIVNDFQFKSDRVCCISDIHIGVHQNSQMWLDICSDWGDWLIKELKKKKIKDIVILVIYFIIEMKSR